MSDDADAFYAYPAGNTTYVRASLVQTSDGALSGADQRSHSITRPADQRALATMRRLADVVIFGGNTVRRERIGRSEPASSDDAALTPDMPVAVISASLDLDPHGSLFADAAIRPYIFTAATAAALRRRAFDGVATVVVADSPAVDMASMLHTLAGDGLTRVLSEAGPVVLAQLSNADLLDEICLTTVPERSDWDAPRFELPAGMTLAASRDEDGLRFERYVRRTSARSKLTGSSSWS